LRLKILEKLRTASLNLEFTGSYKKCVAYFRMVKQEQHYENICDVVISGVAKVCAARGGLQYSGLKDVLPLK